MSEACIECAAFAANIFNRISDGVLERDYCSKCTAVAKLEKEYES